MPPDRPVTVHELIRCHTRHKLLIMAHAPAAVYTLGRLVAGATKDNLDAVWNDYRERFEATLARPASRGGHVNALMHAVGYFRGVLDSTQRQALGRAIDMYAGGSGSLPAVVEQIRRYAEQHGIGYLVEQVYLERPCVSDAP